MKLIEKKLEDLYIVKDGTHDSPKYVSSIDGFPLITSKNLKNGYIDISNVDYISMEDYNKINSRSNVDFGDLLMPMIGSIGNPVLVDIAPEFAIKNVALFKKNVDDNSLEFLKHILNSSFFKKKLANDSKGGTQKFVSLGYLRKLKIFIPEKIEDQNRIAEILTQAENLITQRKESILLLDELLKSTFLEMFIYSTENKDWLFTEVKNTVEKHKNAIKAGPFGSSLKKEFYVESGYKIYGQEQVINDDLNFGNYYINEELYKKLESCKIKEGDILISLVGTYGKISVVPKKHELGIINPRLMKISFDKNIINPIYFKNLFKSDYQLQQLSKLSRGGTMDIINSGIVKEIKIPVPPIELQNKFATIIEKVDVLKSEYGASLRELENMYGVLSQKAFKGELNLRKVNLELYKEEIKTPVAGSLEPPKEDVKIPKVHKKEIEKFKYISKTKRDITNLSLADYYGIPIDIQAKRENIDFDFVSDDLFYQFLLKDHFKDESFTSQDLYNKLHNHFYHNGNMDFDNEKWKNIIFKFLDANPPLLEQIYDESDNSVKLKLTNEAYKA